MNTRMRISMLAALLILLLVGLSCDFAADALNDNAQTPPLQLPQATQAGPTDSGQPAEAPVETQVPETPATAAPAPVTPEEEQPAQNPAAEPDCGQDTCIYPGTFVLQRPIGPSGRSTIDISIRYGSYARNLKAARHGVSFINSTGTPVLAAAGGTVVAAGSDASTPYGPYTNYYGNLVILEHDLPESAEPVYTVYGHLSEVLVESGQNVQAGQEIGRVGSSGDIAGSALAFEIRYGANDYDAARNPELWLVPQADESGQPYGALAGIVMDSAGRYPIVENIVIERLAGKGKPALDTDYLKTYAEDRLKGTMPWGESFAMGSLPAGAYQITFYNGPDLVQREVQVEAGKLTVVSIMVP
jgi:murein DD-endopeptidase MepM/ murein hydrolase activator NlpD